MKFIDRHKGYGYIIDDGASSPREAILFTKAVAASGDDWEFLRPGLPVTYKQALSGKPVAIMVRRNRVKPATETPA